MPTVAAVASLLLAAGSCDRSPGARTAFSGERALEYARAQLAFGPRVPGTDGHRGAGDWIAEQMRARADTVIEQRWTHVTVDGDTLPLRNILAQFRPESDQRILYVAHWDTRPTSDNAPNLGERQLPVPGANDGASGVALLIALADVLHATPPAYGVDLLFVDGEDYGDFDVNKDVLLGSRYFANNLPSPQYRPLFGVVWDMVGAEGARFYQEGYSIQHAPEVVARVWQQADELGYRDTFVPRGGTSVTDDHLPLLEKGIRVIDVIPVDDRAITYAHHHRPSDTIDKLSAATFQKVGDVALSLVQ